jgi:thioredoxin-related protein
MNFLFLTKKIFLLSILGVLSISKSVVYAQTTKTNGKIEWISWEEAVRRNETQPKKIFIDVYTDWCGWCKKMDKSTFVTDSVEQYMSANFYCVKLDAERRDTVVFQQNAFVYVSTGDDKGYHTLAASLLDGQLSFPSFVYLTEKFERVMIAPGFMQPYQIMPQLKFVHGEHFRKESWNDFDKNYPHGK